jgi:hypothetical protein
MLYSEKKSYHYAFCLENKSLEDYTKGDASCNHLRWMVTKHLFNYLENKFFKNIENDPQYFYNFNHPDNYVNLLTNDENKINEISSFFQFIMHENKIMDIYCECMLHGKIHKKYEINTEFFITKLDKYYDYWILNRDLSNSNNVSKKLKI